ncbi:hypothetical protein SLA2020_104680 [Shorea laevis]
MSEAIDHHQKQWSNTSPLPQDGDAYEFSVEGMQVLAIDVNAFCLKYLVSLLRRCKYEVTATTEAGEALKILRENRNKFDIVITNTVRLDFDAFRLLEIIGNQLDIPVIIVSADDRISSVMKSMKYGVVNYMLKPVRIQEIQILWQYVFRKRMQDSGRISKQLKPKMNKGDEEEANIHTFDGSASEDDAFQRKTRVIWTKELHNIFVAAVQALGDNAKPKEIQRIMNVEGISRQSVSSHLQKYRMHLNKERANQQSNNSFDLIHRTYKRKLEGEQNMEPWNQGTHAKKQSGQTLPIIHSTFEPLYPSSGDSASQQAFVNFHSGGRSNYKGLVIEHVRDHIQKLAAEGSVRDNGTEFMQQSVDQWENTAPLEMSYSLLDDDFSIQAILNEFVDFDEPPFL